MGGCRVNVCGFDIILWSSISFLCNIEIFIHMIESREYLRLSQVFLVECFGVIISCQYSLHTQTYTVEKRGREGGRGEMHAWEGTGIGHVPAVNAWALIG